MNEIVAWRAAFRRTLLALLTLSVASSLVVLPSAPAAAAESLKFPFSMDSGAWEIVNGYGRGKWHRGIAAFALDLQRSNKDTAGQPVLAPVTGRVVLKIECEPGKGVRFKAESLPIELEICHLEDWPPEERYVQGTPLGKVTAEDEEPHIHIAIASPTMPFSGAYALDGFDFPAGGSYECWRNQQGCNLRSTNRDPSSSTSPTPTTQRREVVCRYYFILLDRGCDGHVDGWVFSTLDLSQIWAGILRSPERFQKVTDMYVQLLGRAPEPSGLEAWVNSGLSPSEIRQGILQSPESLGRTKCVDAARFVGEDYPDYTRVAGGTYITKVWRVRNAGSCTWGDGHSLVHVWGTSFGAGGAAVRALPGATAEVSLRMVMPASPGTYRGDWQIRSPSGAVLMRLWSILVVSSPGSTSPVGPVTTPAPVTCNPRPDGVTLFADANYGGNCQTFGVGEHTSLGALAGTVSSIRNPGSAYHVTLYDQAGLVGTPGYFDADIAQLTGYWDNRARSIRVERQGSPPGSSRPPAVFHLLNPGNGFTSTNGSGPQFCWTTSTDPDGDTVNYKVLISNAAAPNERQFGEVDSYQSPTIAGTCWQAPDFASRGRYTWYVLASDVPRGGGQPAMTGSEERWSFTITPPAPPPAAVPPVVSWAGDDSLSRDWSSNPVDFGTSPDYEFTAMTLEAEIYVPRALYGAIVAKWDSEPDRGTFVFSVAADQPTPSLWLMLKTSGGNETLKAPSSIPFGAWVRVAATYDGVAVARIFVNGVKVAERNIPNLTRDPNSRLVVGGTSRHTWNAFSGGIRNVRVSASVLPEFQ